MPCLQTRGQDFTFMHDNAAPHQSTVTTAVLHQNNTHVLLPWPAVSPDLNPTEHLWDIFDHQVRNVLNPPQTLVLLELTHA